MARYLFLLVFVSWHCYGQYDEFTIYPNGLIYDESTMNKLGIIVDSLNLKFRSCDLSRPYYANPQGKAHLVDIPNKTVLKEIQEGISFSTFSTRYPHNVKQRDLWIVKTRYKGYEGEKYIDYSGLPSARSEISITLKDKKGNDKVSGWIVDEDGGTALYIVELDQREIPFDYARLVQYVDCMIDTTAEIYLPNARQPDYPFVDSASVAYQFISWAETFPGEPSYPDDQKLSESERHAAYKIYSESYSKWDSMRMLSLDEKMKTHTYGNDLLKEAADDALTTGNSDDRLEFYIARYLSKETALKLMRSRRVVGMCSMDRRPRLHAVNICRLAAETTQWDIFLRSHLDIMNDNFARNSDGNYAWAQRKTYLKELEALDIPAVDLLIGTSLRVSNVSENHYGSSIQRTGRALADAEDKDTLEQRLVTMICDDKLDPFNRLLMAYLFSNYIHNLDDKNRQTSSSEKLKNAVQTMPEYAREAWERE